MDEHREPKIGEDDPLWRKACSAPIDARPLMDAERGRIVAFSADDGIDHADVIQRLRARAER